MTEFEEKSENKHPVSLNKNKEIIIQTERAIVERPTARNSNTILKQNVGNARPYRTQNMLEGYITEAKS